MERIILDTDTAGDDNIALLMALRSRNAKLEAVTINCGNINFDQQVENALYTIEFAGMSGNVPVYPGARHPLVREWKTVEEIHGIDGMGNSFFPRAKQRPEKEFAPDKIVEIINSNPGEITFVEIAPMTNIALAIRKDSSIVKKIKSFYFMGGSNSYLGNVTPVAEFNFWVDPEAAKIVLSSGLKPTMVGWEICMRHALIHGDEMEQIRKIGTREAEFFYLVNRQVRNYMREKRGIDAVSLPDTITISIVLNKDVAKVVKERYVDVEIQSETSRGLSIVDEYNVLGMQPNARVVYEASDVKFKEMLYRLLKGERV